MKKTTQKGITLIALIITIIVMLILVGVTINVALNGGLFDKAKNAKEQTQVETNKEALYSAVVAAMGTDGTINYTTLNEEAAALGFAKVQNGVYTKDGYTYTVDELTGLITARKTEASGEGGGNQTQNSSDLERYILGESGKGRNLFVEQDANEGIISMNTFSFEQDKTDTSSEVYKSVKWGYGFGEDDVDETTGNVFLYIRYGKEVYKVTVEIDPGATDSESDDLYKSKALTHINTPAGHLGEYVKYNGVDYIVMAEDETNGTVDLISADALQVGSNDIALGYNDSGAISAVPAVDENSVTSEEQAARGRWSYNNAVNTLVSKCKDATGLTVDGTNVISIRSVGNTNVKYTSSGITGSDTGTYTYDWQTAGAESDWYTTNNFNSFNMKPEDTNYITDVTKMKQLGIFAADNMVDYWLASRRIDADSRYVDFYVRKVNGIGSLSSGNVCRVDSNGLTGGDDSSYAVRPVVTLKSSLLSFE